MSRFQRTAFYEWTVGLAGVALGCLMFPAIPWRDVPILALLLVIAALLEAIPVPLGKALGSLMITVPMGAMVMYGAGVAINLVIGAVLLTPLTTRRKMLPSTWLFNAGQYSLSAWVMVSIYAAVMGDGIGGADAFTVVAVVLGVAGFLITNHAFINVLHVFRGTFSFRDVAPMFGQDSLNVAVALPLAFLMVIVSNHSMYFGAAVALPIVVVGQIIRVSRRLSVMHGVYRAMGQLAGEFDIEAIGTTAAETAQRLTYADAVVVYVFDQDRERLIPTVIHPREASPNFLLEGHTQEQGGVIWKVIRHREWVYIPNASKDPRVHYDGTGVFFQSLAIFPMHAHGEAQGAIVCYGERPYAFGGDLTEYVRVLADQAAILVENAKLYQTLQEQSWKDAATGLYNYRFFYRELARRIVEAEQSGSAISVVIVDVDYFKKFNDMYGHLAGDVVLRDVGQLLRSLAGHDVVVARYGGEEFAMIFPVDANLAKQRMEQIRLEVSHFATDFNGYRLQGITISSGIASFPLHASGDRDLLLKADSTLYWGAKQRGRNRTAVYMPDYEAQLFLDELTGMYTYHFLNIRTREEFLQGVRSWGVIGLDLDNFTFINTTFGFHVGDRVLKETSILIKECLRQDELACRYAGDEFLVLLPNTGKTELAMISDRLVRAITSHRFPGGGSVVVTVRPNIHAECYENIEDTTDLFNRVGAIFVELNHPHDQSLA